MRVSPTALTAPLEAIVMDFDGVILESNGIKDDVFQEIFARYPDHLDAMMSFHQAHLSAPRRLKTF